MSKTRVVNVNQEQYDILITRGTPWGNPFVIGRDGTRKEVIAKYRMWVLNQKHLMESLSSLEGKRLGCCCAPRPCHGDVLVDLIREKELDEKIFEVFEICLEAQNICS